MAKRKLVQFYRKVPGKKKRVLVKFYRTGKRRKKGITAVLPGRAGRAVHLRVALSDCVRLEDKLRCTVTPLSRGKRA
jgi:hypothetical protein